MSEEIVVFKSEQFSEVMTGAPAIYEQNQTSLARAEAAGQTLLDASKEGMTDILDERIKEFLSKAKATIDVMYERRAPITRTVTQITKAFTSIEGKLSDSDPDGVIATLKQRRDNYAIAKHQAEQKRIQEESLRMSQEKERISIQEDIRNTFAKRFNERLALDCRAITNLFNAMTLEGFESQAQEIQSISTVYPFSFHGSISYYGTPQFISTDEVGQMILAIRKSSLAVFTQEYEYEITSCKAEIISKLPGKRSELEEMAEAEKTNKLQFEKLKAEAEARQKEDEKKAKSEAEERLRAELQANEQKAAESHIQSMFESIPEQTIAVNVKEDFVIEVLQPAGYLAIVQFYFQREGMNETIVKLEKKSLGQMKSFAEKLATKTGEKIISPFLKYSTSIKAK